MNEYPGQRTFKAIGTGDQVREERGVMQYAAALPAAWSTLHCLLNGLACKECCSALLIRSQLP